MFQLDMTVDVARSAEATCAPIARERVSSTACGTNNRPGAEVTVKPNEHKGAQYAAGELEVVLSLAPTSQNIRFLSELLRRSERAIELIYKIAFEHGPFGKEAGVQERKIIAAKERVGIRIGRKKPRET